MKDNKPWYEKVNIWIGIIAGICAIFGVSIFGGKSIFESVKNIKKTVSTSESTPIQSEHEELPPESTSESTPEPTPEPTPTPTSTPEPTPEPISIRNVSEFYSDGIHHSNATKTDNIGNTYNGYTYMVAGDFWVESEGSAVYRNDNQYSRFKGLVIIDEIEKNDEDCGWIKIYGDDSLLFDTGTMGKGIEPKDFDLDISTYTEIKIVFKNGNFASNAAKYAQCYLVDTYFE